MKYIKNFFATLDPRTKIVSFFFVISCMALTPMSRIKDFGVYFLLIVAISLFSGISPLQIFRKFRSTLLPFAVFSILILFILFSVKVFVGYFIKESITVVRSMREDAWAFLFFIVKLELSIVLIVVASLTMSYADFLRGLEKLYIPKAGMLCVLSVLSVLYRIFLLINTIKRLIRFKIYRFMGGKYRKKLRKHTYSMNKLLDKIIAYPEKDCGVGLICDDEEMRGAESLRFSYMDFLFMIGVIVMLICIVSGLIYKIENITINNVHLWQSLQI